VGYSLSLLAELGPAAELNLRAVLEPQLLIEELEPQLLTENLWAGISG
jgi:hypothetical protein